MGENREVVLRVENLKKCYGNVRAVDGVSFVVKRGQLVSILGPNGAGKTTTIEIIEGLRIPDHGTVEYFGTSNTITNEVKERLGVCFQENFFFEDLTVLETLKLYASLYRRSLPLEDIIEMFDLEGSLKKRVRHLSGGQKQRLAVALAFVNDPELVFLDEPTVGLDPHARHHLWDVIKYFKSQGKSIILTTHYMEEAHQLSDMVYIMDHGKIIAQGSPQELINSSGLNAVIEFPATHAYLFEETVTTGDVAIVSTPDVPGAIKRLLDAGVENFIVRHPTLEDVFLKLTGRRID
ncbi:ABC transporter ATP-binding protein [Fervidobacterium thailandense]|uniref:ABC transporter ATP-binding protein n=1 Tax=Fervidobacterium thailandense TaxID=1008305 RepID=A0A1E3G4H6_9BACT|nr:ABC transporter ATP-binding protein [Fervidobacterium thailandense]ODN31157.1 ABC transporter ATP-binding protein [Fervidobacterium thailandense]